MLCSVRLCKGPRNEQRRYCAVLVLKELAENAPTLFSQHMKKALEYLCQVVRDPRELIRETAIAAMRACLSLMAKREETHKMDFYKRIYDTVQIKVCVVVVCQSFDGFSSFSFLLCFFVLLPLCLSFFFFAVLFVCISSTMLFVFSFSCLVLSPSASS